MTTSAPPFAGLPSAHLPARLAALTALTEIAQSRSGPDGISPELIDDAGELLPCRRAAAAVLSAHRRGPGRRHGQREVVLFNRIAGADFSTAGVTRPVTRDVHACVWGVAGSGGLLDWLGVPRRYRYARASALDSGENTLTGLVLLDLPDHDSVMATPAIRWTTWWSWPT